MQEWRVIEDVPKTGESNMNIDRAILASCGSGESLPTLRLYSWEQPTLTVGYAQDFAKEIDINRCQKLGIEIVRRPTGGRALLHNHEVTYSFTAPIPHNKFPPSLLGAYKTVAKALLEGLKEVGVYGAVLASGKKTTIGKHSFHSPSCLSSINHLEIEVQGAKLVGSAQRRTKKAFLQHGSILLDCDRGLVNSLFKFETDDARCRSMEILNHKVVTLSECLGKSMTRKEVFKALIKGFSHTLKGNWVLGHLNSFELIKCTSNSYSKENINI
ncbi:MAG: lipoate--protein ligase family protein [Nitrospinaceae bacterium]|jgi:lipoate-protein ligase A|nr:lipoate--protein ligase family protein [Nitrospina sp.]MDG1843914.1 lipoate--protein ligase family protein [Nitrospinaceae bacterium]